MKIMVGYEGTKGSERILQVTIQQAKAFGAEVHLVTSLIISTLDEERLSEKVQSELDHAKAIMEKEGIACETQVLIRGKSEGIDLIGYADEHEIDEIVIGAKKRSKLEKMLLGSATQHVILEGQCPVLTVKVS
ncbi:MAG: universal stress protein [Deltaproteobacteria bacterium]|nr:universal stress protein [Deltaproteobacteria bacterium]